MSEYGSIDDIKRKVRDNVLKTEPKDASKMQELAGPDLLMNGPGPERAGLYK